MSLSWKTNACFNLILKVLVIILRFFKAINQGPQPAACGPLFLSRAICVTFQTIPPMSMHCDLLNNFR